MVKTRKKQKGNPGSRSGVVLNELDQSNDDLDGWFDSARSPEVESKRNATSPRDEERGINNDRSRETKALKKKMVKTPKQHIDMKLRGSAVDDETEKVVGSTSAKKYVAKLRSEDANDFTSPSDLSRVSTAPFSPSNEGENEPIDTGEAQADAKSNSDIDSETENSLVTKKSTEDIFLQGETSFTVNHSADLPNSKVASAETVFPVDDEDGDDLGPPVFSRDFSIEQRMEEEKVKRSEKEHENISDSPNEHEKIGSGSIGNSYTDDDDREDDEGTGFNMVHDPETPLTVREDRAKKELEKIREERKRFSKKNGPESESDENNDGDDEDSKSPPVKRSKNLKKKKYRTVPFSPKGIPIANRDYETVPIGDLIKGSPDESGPRRSRRVKVKPLEYWRGEKMQFGAHNEHGYIGKALGDMPVVTGIQKALPTPYKKRKQVKRKIDSNSNSRNRGTPKARGSNRDEEFNSKKLRRKYKFHHGEEAYLWDDIAEDTADQKVVSYAANMGGSDLPISKKRKASEGNVSGKAAQAFNISSNHDDYVGYIMGNLLLPPKGIKDSESVGPCSQTFTVCSCQPKALEVAYGDPDQPDGELDTETAQRFLLGSGDMFRVPPGNSYRLENHSDATDCLLTWTIIRPRSLPTDPS